MASTFGSMTRVNYYIDVWHGPMTPQGGGEPQGKLAQAIITQFGGFGQFQEQFGAAGRTQFRSGWPWLSVAPTGKLEIGATANQDTPLSNLKLPILALDVRAHAYYFKYQNNPPEFIANWWKMVNWPRVEQNFDDIAAR